jgi:hypothetical protein
MKTTCPRCNSQWAGEKPEHCTVCHRTFGSTVAGDAHRIGDVGTNQGPNRRRCMTDEEMEAKRIKSGVDAGEPWFIGKTNRYGTVVFSRNIPSRVSPGSWAKAATADA